jgi:hypothetical protein
MLIKEAMYYCPKLLTVVANRTEIKRMAFEHNRERERERELMVWYQRLSGHRQSAHLEIIGGGGGVM